MIIMAAVPLLIGILVAWASRPVAVRVTPSLASILLTSLAVSVSLATGLVLCLAAVVAMAELPPTSVIGHWTPDVLRDRVPMPPAIGALAGAVAAVLLICAAAHVGQVLARSRRMSTAVAQLPPQAGDLVVLDDRAAVAYALAGRYRRIVVSTGMLRLLSGAQRRALLAHEAAHLRYHHQAYVELGRLAATANPLMRPVSRAIELAVERWADEAAVRAVGDRNTVARAVGAAAIGRTRPPAGALAGAQSNVATRVQLLIAPRRSPRILVTVIAVTGLAACWAAALLLTRRVDDLLELARSVGAH
jgi:hypothetical protein